jgi:hypothetical protein
MGFCSRARTKTTVVRGAGGSLRPLPLRKRKELQILLPTEWMNGFALRVNNEGHHWMWQKGGFVAEWWPSSAKLVFNRNYDRSFDAHDWTTVIPFLESKTGGF